MSHPTFFVQECPICGRNLEVRVTYLGRKVVCQHCGGDFVADDGSGEYIPSESDIDLLDRAAELLEATSPPKPR